MTATNDDIINKLQEILDILKLPYSNNNKEVASIEIQCIDEKVEEIKDLSSHDNIKYE